MECTVDSPLPSTSRITAHTLRAPRNGGRQSFSLGVQSPLINDDANAAGLNELLSQTWTICGVSALFGFNQDEVYLKMYAKRMREHIATKLTKEDVMYDATFKVRENLGPRPSPKDHLPIQIEVIAKTVGREENVVKCIYKGILLSWKTTSNEQNNGNSVRLPLLLCRGTRSCMEAVHNILSHMFDCMVLALPAKEEDLMWLLPIILLSTNGEDEPKASDMVALEYTIPGLPVTDTITLKFKVLDLTKMLSVIIGDENDGSDVETILDLEHIEKFYEVLNTQMLDFACLQLGLCTLRRINLPALTIMDNRMKVNDTEALYRVLLYLNKKAVGVLHTLHFNV